MCTYDITVVIPAYRAEKWIKRAIQSVQAQPGVKAEIVVVEDGAFDDTRAIVSSFPEVRLVTLPRNVGAPAARNRGLAESAADFVMFLDADDFVEGPLLRGLIAALSHPGADIAFGPFRFDGEGITDHAIRMPTQKNGLEWVMSWLRGGSVPPCSVVWRRDYLIAQGGWRDGLPRNQDGELIIRCLLEGCAATISKRGAGVYWQHHSVHRITARPTLDLLKGHRIVHSLISEWITRHPDDSIPMQRSLAESCYGFARLAFSNRLDEPGRWWLNEARRLGLRGHPGTLAHWLVAGMVGLPAKQRISQTLRSVVAVK